MPSGLPFGPRISILLLGALLLSSCGAEGPTDPEGPRERTFTGRLNVQNADSLGGIFHLTTIVADGFVDAQPEENPMFARVRSWFVSLLWAQAGPGTATGSLVANHGEIVPLSGTYSGGSFSVTGGGYAIAANVGATGSLSGTGTAPGGDTGAVSPLYTGSTAPPPSNPTGSYVGTFEMFTTLRSRNVTPTGALIGTCIHPVRITGDLLMHVSQVGQSNQVTGHLDVTWRERPNGGSTCPPGFSHIVDDYYGIDFDGVATGLHPVRTHTGPAGPGNAGSFTRTVGFSGMVSGNTVVGTVFLTMNFTTPVPEGIHTENFSPAPSATVTLTRR